MMQALAQVNEENDSPVISQVSEGYAGGVRIVWWAKMAIKITLAHLPLSYKLLSSMGIFRHGDIADNIDNLRSSFDENLDFYKARKGRVPEFGLELGPGDSVGHALCAQAAGMKGLWLVDVGDFATKNQDHYNDVREAISKTAPFDYSDDYSREGVLSATNSHYITNGLKGMTDIPDESLELSFSQAVLEHVYRKDFQNLMNELFRTLKPGGLSRHWVDLHDHLGGALNSFRFAPWFWEIGAVRRAGFYTNRLTMNEMAECARNAGFKVKIEHIVRWASLPTPHDKMHKSFDVKSEEELNVCTFLIVMEKP